MCFAKILAFPNIVDLIGRNVLTLNCCSIEQWFTLNLGLDETGRCPWPEQHRFTPSLQSSLQTHTFNIYPALSGRFLPWALNCFTALSFGSGDCVSRLNKWSARDENAH